MTQLAVGNLRPASWPTVLATKYGVVADGVTDDTAAWQRAITAVEAAGGGVLLAPVGRTLISGLLTVPSSVSLRGAGSAQNTTDAATWFQCTAAGAGISFTGDGGDHGNFGIDGNNIATSPFRRLTSNAGAVFRSIDVRYAAGDGITINYAQNDTYIAVQSQNSALRNLVLDNSCGGLVFIGCEFSNSGRENLIVQQTGAPVGYPYPTDITFQTCRFERAQSGSYASVQHNQGEWIRFRDCGFSHAAGSSSAGIFQQLDGATGVVIICNGQFTAQNAGNGQTAIIGGANVAHPLVLQGRMYFNAVQYVLYNRATRFIELQGWSSDPGGGVTTYNPSHNSGGCYENLNGYLVQNRGSAVDAAWRVYILAEANARFQALADGKMSWGPGSAAQDTNLYRVAANQLQTDDTLIALDGVVTKTKAGAPVDGDFQTPPANGTIVIDTTNSKIYVRIGGTWKATAALV